MKYLILNLFNRSFVLIIFLCALNCRLHFVESNEKPMETLINNNKNEFRVESLGKTSGLNDELIEEKTNQSKSLNVTNFASNTSKNKDKNKTSAGVSKYKSTTKPRVSLIWNAAQFGVCEPKPWSKGDKESVRNNARAEQLLETTGLSRRNASFNVGGGFVESVPNKLSVSGCGKAVTMFIVNGKKAAEGAHPWIAVILKHGDALCAGTIINKNWIISASHCFMRDRRPEILTIRVGTNNRNKGTDYKVSKVIMHERFNIDNMLNSDIALMKIVGPIKMSRLVKPICMPSHTYKEPKSDSLMVTGWGVQKFDSRKMPILLQEVQLNIVNSKKCAKKYSIKKHSIYRSQICTWNKDQDACQGDSGGPAIQYLNGKGTLVGIVSYGATCADEFPGVFTKVSYFLNWISTNMKKN